MTTRSLLVRIYDSDSHKYRVESKAWTDTDVRRHGHMGAIDCGPTNPTKGLTGRLGLRR